MLDWPNKFKCWLIRKPTKTLKTITSQHQINAVLDDNLAKIQTSELQIIHATLVTYRK